MFENTLELSLLLLDALIGENFRRRKVGKNTFAFEMRAGSKSASKAGHVARREPQPVHAGLKLHMEFDAAAGSSRGAFQKPQLLAARDRRGQIVLDQALLLAGPKAREHENGLAYLALAQFDSLGGRSYPKPIRPGLSQGTRDGNSTMAVSVRLHNRQDL